MNRHVCLRPTSRLLPPAVIFFQLPSPAIAQSVASTPSLAEGLDRRAAEHDCNRIDLHVPGAALALARAEEVIFARGFGVVLAPDTFTLQPSAESGRGK